MSESQPDMLGGKAVSASRLRKVRTRAKAPVRREGWAGTPGAGPEGETCGSCTYCESFHFKKTYHKCGARSGDHWKGGRATDIRPLDPACEKWSPTTERVNIEKAKAIGSHQPEPADARGSRPQQRAVRASDRTDLSRTVSSGEEPYQYVFEI